MHMWGDENVDWAGLDQAANFLGNYCRRRALLSGQAKEKFGTVRYYASGWGQLSLHTMVYPNYCYNQFPKWLWNIDCAYIGPALTFLFSKPLYTWQKFIYKRAYHLAVKKWPHLRKEILCAADYPEFIGL